MENEKVFSDPFFRPTTFEDDHLVKSPAGATSAKSAKLLATLILDSYELALARKSGPALAWIITAQSDQIKQTNTQITELKNNFHKKAMGISG